MGIFKTFPLNYFLKGSKLDIDPEEVYRTALTFADKFKGFSLTIAPTNWEAWFKTFIGWHQIIGRCGVIIWCHGVNENPL